MLLAQAGDHCEARDAIKDNEIVGAYLWYDGYVALADQTKFVPISETLYTQGRPEREAVPGGTSDCIDAGGIPMLSDRLYQALDSLGAEGTLGAIVYRGFNKKAYDKVQRGFHRFVPTPSCMATDDGTFIVELRDELPDVFAIETARHVKFPKAEIRTEIHIGLSVDGLYGLACELPRVLIRPLKQRG